jgi:hypothetical protein
VAYEIDVGSVPETLSGLPHEAVVALAEAMAVLERTPWAGEPLVDRNPGEPCGPCRSGPAGW